MLFVFDINETMLDLEPLDAVFARHLGDASLRPVWFDGLIHAALTTTAAGEYEDFGKLGGASMRRLAQQRGIDIPDDAVMELGTTMKALSAHPEVPGALRALANAGHRLVALGNSPMATIEQQIMHAGLDTIERIYSAEQVGQLKPGRAPYMYVLEQEDVEAPYAVMVAAHDWDIAGAQAAGMRTAFIGREGRLPLAGRPAPTLVARDFTELVERMDELVSA